MVKHVSLILVKKKNIELVVLCVKRIGPALYTASVRGERVSLVLPKKDKGPARTQRVSFFSLSLSHPGRSVRQSVEEAVDQRGRRYQVLQLQVEDPLKALGPLGAELCPQTQDAIEGGRRLGRGGRRAAAQVISEAANHFILQLLDPLRVLQAWDLLCGWTQMLE